ncbi:hypothetical protein ABK040_011037 [Willaertia magna]
MPKRQKNNRPDNSKVKLVKKELCGIENIFPSSNSKNKYCQKTKSECWCHKEYHQLIKNGEIPIDYNYIDSIYKEFEENNKRKWKTLSLLYKCVFVVYLRLEKKLDSNYSTCKFLKIDKDALRNWLNYDIHKNLIKIFEKFFETRLIEVKSLIVYNRQDDNKVTTTSCKINYLKEIQIFKQNEKLTIQEESKETLNLLNKDICGIETSPDSVNKYCQNKKGCKFHEEYHAMILNGEITIDHKYIDSIYKEVKEMKEKMTKEWGDLSLLYKCTLIAYLKNTVDD